MIVLLFLICLSASMVGSICGIGGGIIIKPLLDALKIMEADTISFLSGCTVLAMTAYSVGRSKLNKGSSHLDSGRSFPLAMGAALGGVLGKQILQAVLERSESASSLGFVQAICLLFVTLFTLLYTLQKKRIVTHNNRKAWVCILIGMCLGGLSAFLGIGGGPLNLVVLYYFFSMTTREATENSLYVIFVSQCMSLFVSIVSRSVPAFASQIPGIHGAWRDCGRYGRKKHFPEDSGQYRGKTVCDFNGSHDRDLRV